MSRTPLTFSYYIVTLVFVALTLTPSIFAKQQENVIKRLIQPNEPVEVVSVAVGSQPVSFDQPFAGDTDWLRDLTVTLRNTSSKPIAYIAVELFFPEVLIQGHPLSLSLMHGQSPDTPSSVRNYPTLVQPNSTVRLGFSEHLYNALQTVMAENGVRLAITQVRLKIDVVAFNDDTSWSVGLLHRRDPNNPRRWIPIRSSTPTSSSRNSVNRSGGALFDRARFSAPRQSGCVYYAGYQSRQCGECSGGFGTCSFNEEYTSEPPPGQDPVQRPQRTSKLCQQVSCSCSPTSISTTTYYSDPQGCTIVQP